LREDTAHSGSVLRLEIEKRRNYYGFMEMKRLCLACSFFYGRKMVFCMYNGCWYWEKNLVLIMKKKPN
jgi:hypothetical protein